MANLSELLEAQGEEITSVIASLVARRRALEEELDEVNADIAAKEKDRAATWAAMDIAIKNEKATEQ